MYESYRHCKKNRRFGTCGDSERDPQNPSVKRRDPSGNLYNTLSDTTGWLIASAIYGILSMIMELDRPAFWWRALIHCSLCAAVTVITAWALGDETGLGQTAKLVLPSFFIIYIGISFIIYLWERQCVKKLNKKLK